MTTGKLVVPDLWDAYPKVRTSDLTLQRLMTGHAQGVSHATGHTADRLSVVTRLAGGTFSVNRKGTNVLVSDDEGDVIEKWPLQLQVSGHDFVLTPKILEEGNRLKLTLASMDGEPVVRPAAPAGAAAAPGIALRSPRSESDLTRSIMGIGFSTGAFIGAVIGGIIALPTLELAGVVTIPAGLFIGGAAGTLVGGIIAEIVT
ncbi:hypothetical protein [Nocardia sp. AG03]|uniref:hypothetical protein n=1 Tax=Nocardia sp. AG03 TaxID=3025312 RepID=UPI0024188382|nr:hypothetical protein [Nocardia sp. AG03]